MKNLLEDKDYFPIRNLIIETEKGFCYNTTKITNEEYDSIYKLANGEDIKLYQERLNSVCDITCDEFKNLGFFEQIKQYFYFDEKENFVCIYDNGYIFNYCSWGIIVEDYIIRFDEIFKKFGIEYFPENIIGKMKGLKGQLKIRVDFNKIVSLKKFRYIDGERGAGGERDGVFKMEYLFDDHIYLVTKIRNNPKFSNWFDNSILKTEFFIENERENIKKLEIEDMVEFLDNDIIFCNRYIHCEINKTDRYFKHFDGKILFYNEENFNKRLNSYFDGKGFGKMFNKYIKFFRIDNSNMLFEDWFDIIEHFFWRNEMILEYFNKEEYIKKYNEFGILDVDYDDI